MFSKAYYTGRKIYYILVALLVLGFIINLIYINSNFSITGNLGLCFFNVILHIYCPGCGGTRSVDYFLHGDLINSFFANPIIVYCFIIFLIYFCQATYTFLIKKNGHIYYKMYYPTIYAFPIIILLHFFIRNVLLIYFQFDFLGDCLIFW